MQLLHLSDPHFCSDSYNVEPYKIEKGLIDIIKSTCIDREHFYLVVTGDISFKGKKDGFRESKSFFEHVLKKANLKHKNVIVCPGNHDITNEGGIKSFKEFNKFCYGLRKDSVFDFKKYNNNIYFDHDYCFLSINTSFHLDHGFGKVDIEPLSNLLGNNKDKIRESKIKIIIFHHHIINILEEDISSIRNAYCLFGAINDYNFDFVFHGHQHATQLYNINKIIVNSVSSLLEERSASNLIAIYEIKDNRLEKKEYVYLQDKLQTNGERGGYVALC